MRPQKAGKVNAGSGAYAGGEGVAEGVGGNGGGRLTAACRHLKQDCLRSQMKYTGDPEDNQAWII